MLSLCFLEAFGAAVVAAEVDVADKHALDTSMNIHVRIQYKAQLPRREAPRLQHLIKHFTFYYSRRFLDFSNVPGVPTSFRQELSKKSLMLRKVKKIVKVCLQSS